MIARPVSTRLALTAAALAAVVGVAAGCGGGGGSSSSVGAGVVANVNGDKITQAQLDEVIVQAQARLKAQGQKVPAAGSTEYQTFEQNALQYLVQRTQYAQQAAKLGVTVTDKQVQDRLDQLIKQYFKGSQKKYQQSLKQQGMTDAQVRSDVRAQLIASGLFAKVGGPAKVTEAEIEAYYKSSPTYKAVPTREVRHILVASKALADDIYAKLKAGADFAALAKKYSTDPGTKDVGGKLTIQQGQTVPGFDKAAFALKVNQISKPVHTRFGWHVIQALGPTTPGRVTPLKDARSTIEQQLKGQKQQAAVTTWLAKLKQQYKDKITYAKGFAPAATTTTTTTTSSTG